MNKLDYELGFVRKEDFSSANGDLILKGCLAACSVKHPCCGKKVRAKREDCQRECIQHSKNANEWIEDIEDAKDDINDLKNQLDQTKDELYQTEYDLSKSEEEVESVVEQKQEVINTAQESIESNKKTAIIAASVLGAGLLISVLFIVVKKRR